MSQPSPPSAPAERDRAQPLSRLNPAETLKANSRALRGTLRESLADPLTGALRPDDVQIVKFHGIYEQDDRDLRNERRRQKLEPAYEFMVRLRLPAGLCRPAQWLALAGVAERYGNGSLRLTTRQTVQLHAIEKRHLKPALQALAAAGLDTLGACGDDNRGVVCTARPGPLHAEVVALAAAVSAHLLPRTAAWREIWLDEPPAGNPGEEEEDLYGPTYLPRKFKIGFAMPPDNDIDVFAQDLGFIAIAGADGRLAGFNVAVGGGLGRSEHAPETYPRLADVIGFCAPQDVIRVAEQVVAIQRDHGDRVDRKHARFKYTLDTYGLPWFAAQLAECLGRPLAAARPWQFDTHADRFGWAADGTGAHMTLFIPGGRVRDVTLAGLNAVAQRHTGLFHLTPNQNLVVAGIPADARDGIAALLADYQLDALPGPLARQAIACVALPTCGLAMAEAERYLPALLTRLEALLAEHGLADNPLHLRLSGCPNGCARPYIADIGLSGRGPGTYNLYLGGGGHGERLAAPVLDNASEDRIVATLTPLLAAYAAERAAGEAFGDFLVRSGRVRAVQAGRTFNLPPD